MIRRHAAHLLRRLAARLDPPAPALPAPASAPVLADRLSFDMEPPGPTDYAPIQGRMRDLAAQIRRERETSGPGVLLLDGADDPAPLYLPLATLHTLDAYAGVPGLALRMALAAARMQGADPARDAVVLWAQQGILRIAMSRGSGAARVVSAA